MLGVVLGPCFCGVVVGALDSLAIILLRKGEVVALIQLCCGCCDLCLFLIKLWVGLQSVIVACPDQTHLIFC